MAWSTREIAELADVSLRAVRHYHAPAARVEMSDADRSLFTVLTRVLGPAPRRAYAEMLRNQPDDPVSKEFDALPADADERTRQDVAERMVPGVREVFAAYPDLRTPHIDAPRGEAFAKKTVGKVFRDLYNPAQLDALRRLDALLATD